MIRVQDAIVLLKAHVGLGMCSEKPIMFYGAGRYAADNLERWLSEGLIPVCFIDADEEKHNALFPFDSNYKGAKFEILSLSEAIKKYYNDQILNYYTIKSVKCNELPSGFDG